MDVPIRIIFRGLKEIRCNMFVVKHQYHMDAKEYNTAHVYILCNTPGIRGYLQMYHEFLEELDPESSDKDRHLDVSKNFCKWFATYVPNNMNTLLNTLSGGPALEIKRYKGYYVNGYYFDNRQGDGNKSTFKSGVCVKGSCYEDDDHVDYYGVIEEWSLLDSYVELDVSPINTEDIFQEEQQDPPVLVDPTHDIDVVEEGVYVILKDDDDDVERSSNEDIDYESDYPDEDDDYEQAYWGDDAGDDNNDYSEDS
ncbi:hypothetical protein LIER_29507 [Lithospermum erythrorhizon]|uniref:Uncharacterized protein n=1 Tax=Lithospermum erythrorhizon TaxID=34254 RepID=A0AAV3RN22_LITER